MPNHHFRGRAWYLLPLLALAACSNPNLKLARGLNASAACPCLPVAAKSLSQAEIARLAKAQGWTDRLGQVQPQASVQGADGQLVQVGEASWYGPGFHGRRTASGEIYNQWAMTAAHQKLPLGSVVRVTNLSDGRSAVLRITDRGPYYGSRVLDVSRKAAAKLGFVQDGITQVQIEIMPPAKQ
jgi:rare lipoprotein A